MDGITATARLREENNIPAIMLTAKSDDSDKVLGLVSAQTIMRPGRSILSSLSHG